MVIDSKYIENGITAEVLAQLIRRNEIDSARYQMLYDYYKGKHEISGRRKSEELANNRIVINHAKYITEMSMAYFLGSPITYSVSDGYDIEAVKDCFSEQNISSVDSILEKQASICGRAVEMIWCNEKSQPRSTVVPASCGFVVYDDTVEHNKLFGVHYYRKQRIDGTIGDYVVRVMDSECEYIWAGSTVDSLQKVEEKPHYYGIVPFVEYLNNEEQQGDFEQEISLIDAYNTLMSDRLNDKEQFVDAFLLLLGIDIDSEQAKKLKAEKILCGEIDGKAEYLSKSLNEADTEVLRNAIKEDIHKISMVPDLTDAEFAGNMSGVAIKYKLLGFEQNIRNKERLFEKGLRERLEIYIKILSFKSAMADVPVHRIDVEFHRNLPANELELSQMIANLSGLVSDETLLSRVPFVTDAKEEAKLAAKERQKKQQAAMASMTNYKTPVKASEEDEE